MIDFPNVTELCRSTPSKIVLLVVDGLGGLPHPDTGKSELETANIPNLDRLASESACGLTTPVAPGITPGSGPGHVALFGYDPVKRMVGRGVMEAIGIGVEMSEGQVAARGNFCTVDENGRLTDRRAGRISTSESARLVERLNAIAIPDVEVDVYPVKEHRFAVVFSGEGLDERVAGTDPQRLGARPLEARATDPRGERTAQAARDFVDGAREALREHDVANMALLRGFSSLPTMPSMVERLRLNPACIAAYPMYRGLAKLAGMEIIPTGETFDDELSALERSLEAYDFFFIHYKPADTAGEDGDFGAKVSALEYLDARIPRLLDLNVDALVVAGDHSTPAILGAHSWHPVPLMVRAKPYPGDGLASFSERKCALGSIGRIPATSVMPIAMASAGKLNRFGP